MDRSLRYHPLFDCDVREAAGWYDRRSPGLGDEFIRRTRERVEEVISNSERFGSSVAGCRYVRLVRFPYVVLFEVTESEILFLGVLHTARSIDKWKQRQSSD